MTGQVKATDRDRELAAEIFRGESTEWYQQAVDAIVRARAEEREECVRIADDVVKFFDRSRDEREARERGIAEAVAERLNGTSTSPSGHK